jgi:hypothetical protein
MRGSHMDPFNGLAAQLVSRVVRSVLYDDIDDDAKATPEYSVSDLRKLIHARDLLWAPDGDEAFDDGGHVLQFDVGDQVRLIAFKTKEDQGGTYDVSEAWIGSNPFYGLLSDWLNRFEAQRNEALRVVSPQPPE